MKIRSRTLAFSVLGALALGAALIWAFMPRPPEVETATARVARFEASVEERARTRVRERYLLTAPLSGTLSRVALREGDAVERGVTVATLSPALPPLLDARTEAELSARLAAAGANVARADLRIAQARIARTDAESALRRHEGLQAGGYISARQLESDRAAAQAARREVELAEQERRIARHERDLARAALSAARSPEDAATFALRAPVSGRVLRVLQSSAGNVSVGAPVLEIGDVRELEVVAELLTEDALRTGPGTPVRIVDWGGAGELVGRVRRVEPGGYTKISALGVEEQRVNVLIDILSPYPQWSALGDGYRVGVRILVRDEAAALQVPVSAVFPAPDAAGAERMAVFRVEDGRARLTPVELIARNGESAWIGGGVRAGAVVIVYPGDTIEDGARVKLRDVPAASTR